jgi:hypothetical protein
LFEKENEQMDELLVEAINLLRKLEHVEGDAPIDPGECPFCGTMDGHWDRCPLGQFLEKAADRLGLEHTPAGRNWDALKYAQKGHRDRLFKEPRTVVARDLSAYLEEGE